MRRGAAFAISDFQLPISDFGLPIAVAGGRWGVGAAIGKWAVAVVLGVVLRVPAPAGGGEPGPVGPGHGGGTGEPKAEPSAEERELARLRRRQERLLEIKRRYEKELGKPLDRVVREPLSDSGERPDARLSIERSTDRDDRTVYRLEVGRARLRSVLERLALEAGVELVLDEDLSRRELAQLVTVALRAATLRETLDLLLGRFDLGYSLGTDALVVVPGTKEPFATAEERLRQKAQHAYRVALATYPDHPSAPRACLTLGQFFHTRGMHAQAVEQFQTLLRDYPGFEGTAAALDGLARSFASVGEAARAEAASRSIVANHPNSPQAAGALLTLGRSALKSQRPKKAIGLLEELLRGCDDAGVRAAAQVDLAEALFTARRYPEAVERLGKLLAGRLAPALERRARLLVARSRFHRGELPEVRAACHRLLSDHPDTPESAAAHLLIARTLLHPREGRYPEAILVLGGILKHSPDSAVAEQAAQALGDLYRKVALADRAIATYGWILKNRPESALRGAMHLAIGEVQCDKGNYQPARHSFERAAGAAAELAAGAADDEAAAAWRRLAWRARIRAGEAALADGRPQDALAVRQRVVAEAQSRELRAAAC